ncbi:MAG: hypothetical protein EOP84_02665, partial [Verrucomicrobiaceae bacterium]
MLASQLAQFGGKTGVSSGQRVAISGKRNAEMTSSVDPLDNPGSSPDILLASFKGQVEGHRAAIEAVTRQLEYVVRQSATSASQSSDIIRALRDRIDDLNIELSIQRDLHADALDRLAASERQFATALSAARAQVLAIQNSTSWRISAPVRLLGGVLIK